MNTMTNYDSIDEALNTSSAIDVTPTSKPQKVESSKDDVTKDYDYTRANLYSLVEKGQEALNWSLEVAGEGGSARAYEVAGQIIKSVADTSNKLMDLQKKVKKVDEEKKQTTNNVNNNALCVGLTSEISNMLKQGILNNIEDS